MRLINEMLADYRSGRRSVRETLREIMTLIRGDDPRHVWIHVLSDEELDPYLQRLEMTSPDELPLYGIPFALKDNIDLAGIPTTAACREYTHVPQRTAFTVQRLIEAGAVPVGKTNLDQFATGLVGTRSPFGACGNAFNGDWISGGSSSGSAVAVALGQVPFSLGTDTAGSGRVPAALNNLVGVKPTRGLLSASGVVPACRSLDTLSIFAATTEDASCVLDVAIAYDPSDSYAREPATPRPGRATVPTTGFRFGVPREEDLAFFGNDEGKRLFFEAADRLEALGGERVTVCLEPFLKAARLLYEGPWVAERYAAIQALIESRPEALLAVTHDIISGARRHDAVDAFKAAYALQDLRRESEAVWSEVDLIITPTVGRGYRIDEVDADPIRLNSTLGHYTNFMNLLDLAALAVPAGIQKDGWPFGVTLFGPANLDRDLLALGGRFQAATQGLLGATRRPLPDNGAIPSTGSDHPHVITVAVCGAHMRGLPLNHQLVDRHATWLEATTTAPEYRFYALPGGPPERPGLVRVEEGGQAIEVELWAVPADRFGSFVAQIPAPLGIGKIRLCDGREVTGFLCESVAVKGGTDITHLGGWRPYLQSACPQT